MTTVLLATAVATAAFHTLIPDHWLPFVLIGRARNWSRRTTGLVSGLSALLHTLLSVALGLIAIGIGIETARWVGESLERAGGFLLVAFGLGYAAWAWRKGGHFHPAGRLLHGPERADPGPGNEAAAEPEHLHYHADRELIAGRGGRGAIYLAVIVGLNPCVLVLPIMVAGARHGPGTVALVTAAYAATTVALMVGLAVLGVTGARKIRLPAGARHMEMASGLVIVLVGLVVLWLEP